MIVCVPSLPAAGVYCTLHCAVSGPEDVRVQVEPGLLKLPVPVLVKDTVPVGADFVPLESTSVTVAVQVTVLPPST